MPIVGHASKDDGVELWESRGQVSQIQTPSRRPRAGTYHGNNSCEEVALDRGLDDGREDTLCLDKAGLLLGLAQVIDDGGGDQKVGDTCRSEPYGDTEAVAP